MNPITRKKFDLLQKEKRPRWIWIFCYIGHDLHGHFDRNHVDFELCCGVFHTEKIAYALPILFALVAIIMTVSINCFRLSAFNNLHAAPLIPNAIFLWRAIKTNNHTMVYRIFVLNTGTMTSWLTTIIIMVYTVFRPGNNLASDYVTLLTDSDYVGKELAILLMILIFAIHFYIMVYLNWNLLFYATYMCHMNTNMCAHTADCPGIGDYDPNWHRITP